MSLLEDIREPAKLRGLTQEQLSELVCEIRLFLVDKVARTGGHLGPNLGVIELTIALHRVFDSPWDRILWDTGHQAYVHKILTDRWSDFDHLRQKDGLSGYPSRAESEHDLVENSHASTALSYADGLAKAYQLTGEDRAVVAVIGDGALTGGMAWEALNNIAAGKDRRIIIVVNDNGRSYAPTIGGMANHLATLRTTQGYERFLDWGEHALKQAPVIGGPICDTLHGVKTGLINKDIVAPQSMFEDLGLKYVGPIDGHDIEAVESALRRAARFGGSVIVHCLTRKGNGYPPAESDELDRFHAVRGFDPTTGQPVSSSADESWTEVFGAELVQLGEERPDVVAITAAMLDPTGLSGFAAKFPDRTFDVGIAEQHAVTSAAGLAMGGMRPVVALYSTFLNRAIDQIIMDVALHSCPVTFVLDRAGVTGDDGPSHNGMWDLSLLQVVPGLRIAAPRDATRLRRALRESVEGSDGPAVVRFPKGAVMPDVPALNEIGTVDVLWRTQGEHVLIVGVGAMVGICLDLAGRLDHHGIGATVVDPRWIKPVSSDLVDIASRYRMVVTVEDNLRIGGFGATLAQALRDANVELPVRNFGIPHRFLEQGKRAEVLSQCGLTAQQIARAIVESTSSWNSPLDAGSVSTANRAGLRDLEGEYA